MQFFTFCKQVAVKKKFLETFSYLQSLYKKAVQKMSKINQENTCGRAFLVEL